MKKKLTAIFLFFIVLIFYGESAFSINVNVKEIKKGKKVVFTNYRGRQKRKDSIKAVIRIGQNLAKKTKKSKANREIYFYNKYSVIRAISQKQPKKFSADIVSIKKNARVKHIKYIRRILSGYLQKMYHYSYSDAYALAVFVTYYNAVYRKDIKYFSKTYKKIVIQNINKNNAGLSTKYYNWPGKTKIIIPLTKNKYNGKIDSIDPNIISDDKTNSKIRKDDKNLKYRKKIVIIKKKEINKEKKILKKKKERIKKDEKTISKKKKQLQKKKENIEKKKNKLKKITDPKKRKKEEKKIKKEEKQLKKEETKIIKKEKKLKKKKEETKKEEKKIIEKEKKIKKEKEQIKKDEERKKLKDEIKKDPKKAEEKLQKKEEKLQQKEKELEKREDKLKQKKSESKNILGKKLFYLKINEWIKNGHYKNEMYMIDATNGKVLFKSPVTNIAGRKYNVFSKGVLVITYKNDYDSNHQLTLLSPDNLKLLKRGNDDIFWRSFIEINDNFIFAIMEKGGKYFLGKFDADLKLIAKSKEQADKNSFITFFEDFIYINRSDKRIMVLSKKDLKLIKIIKP